MSFLRRMFSADFRRALEAEAAGDYAEAARAYALAGERAKVAEMHLLRAQRAPSAEGKLYELRAAVRWADLDESDGRAVRRRIARSLISWVRAQGLITDGDRQVVREAAALFSEVGDHAGAGECHELVGEELQAAEAYQKAGEVDRLERVLEREETRRKQSLRVSETYDEYRLHLAGGEPDLARASLITCIEAAPPAEQADYRRLLQELEGRIISDGRITLRTSECDTQYVGSLPLVIGREPTCQLVLRDAGISRRHAELTSTATGFQLRDLDSKNGTLLSGVRVAGTLPLEGEGELGFGEHCGMRFVVAAGLLELRVNRGLDRGVTVIAGSAPLPLSGFGTGERLRFVEGRPRLESSRVVKLNGRAVGAEVQLARRDVIEIDGRRLEVL